MAQNTNNKRQEAEGAAFRSCTTTNPSPLYLKRASWKGELVCSSHTCPSLSPSLTPSTLAKQSPTLPQSGPRRVTCAGPTRGPPSSHPLRRSRGGTARPFPNGQIPRADVRPPKAILPPNSRSLHSSSLNSPPHPTRPWGEGEEKTRGSDGPQPCVLRDAPGPADPEAGALGARGSSRASRARRPGLQAPSLLTGSWRSESRRAPRPDDRGAAPARGPPPGPRLAARRAGRSLPPPPQLRHLSRHLASTPLPPPQAGRPRRGGSDSGSSSFRRVGETTPSPG